MSKESQVAEVLEDGTIYVFDMDVCDKEADKAIKSLFKKEGKLLNFDFGATIFSLFVYCIHILRSNGWPTEELIDEIIMHTQEYDEADGIMVVKHNGQFPDEDDDEE